MLQRHSNELETILTNCRKYVTVLSITYFLSDLVMVYPKFYEKLFFPNQVGIILEGLV